MEVVEDALASGHLATLLGVAESQTLEAKSVPYDLELASDRYELAKDVAALANEVGGYLIIGIGTTRESTKDLDILTDLKLVRSDTCSTSQYVGVISQHVYPKVVGLTATFVANEGGADGVFAIHVPAQHEDQKPFLIMKVVEGTEQIKEIVVGYAQRMGDSSQPLSPAELHRKFKQGMDTTAQRLTRIEEKLDTLTAPSETARPGTAHEEVMEQRMLGVLRDE